MANKNFARMLALLLTVALFGAACGSSDEKSEEVTEQAAASSATGAATLRAGLTELLQEHVYLAALATGAALRGDNAGFTATRRRSTARPTATHRTWLTQSGPPTATR